VDTQARAQLLLKFGCSNLFEHSYVSVLPNCLSPDQFKTPMEKASQIVRILAQFFMFMVETSGFSFTLCLNQAYVPELNNNMH
jgi:hypothetical protein